METPPTISLVGRREGCHTPLPSQVDGEALPGTLSSLPGLVLWEGDDGPILTVAQGQLECAADGKAEEGYLFRPEGITRQWSA